MATNLDEVLQTIIEKATRSSVIMALTEDVQKITRLSELDAAAFLGYSQSSLAHKRAEQGRLSAAERDMKCVGSIPCFPEPVVEYRLYDLVQFKLRQEPVTGRGRVRSEETKKKASDTFKANAAKREKDRKDRLDANTAANATRRGFGEFMQSALGADTWPFSIQPDGRPMDLYSAILDGKLTGRAERLNLREFGDRLATASDKALSNFEANEIASVALLPKAQKKTLKPQTSGKKAKDKAL